MTSSTRRSIIKAAGATATAILFSREGLAQEDSPLRIGFSMSRTGPMAQATVTQFQTYELWREQLNASGGMNVAGRKRKVEFVFYDDQSRPEQAVRVYEKLITDDKVDLLLAPWGTPFHIAIAPVLEKYRFPVVGNTAASVNLRKMKPGYIWFTTSVIPDRIAVELSAFLTDYKVKTVAVIANILPLAKEIKTFLEPELRKAGIETRLTTEYPPDIKDMTSIITQIKKADVEGVLVLSYPGDSLLYARQAKELGVTSPFQFLAIGPCAPHFTATIGLSAAQGIVTNGYWTARPEWRGAQEFRQEYIKKFGEEPDYLNSVESWISLEILGAAVAKSGLDREKIREFIGSQTFDTIAGKIKFDGVQNSMTPTGFLQFQPQGMKLVWPRSIADGQFIPKSTW